jgi:hypothetical protein
VNQLFSRIVAVTLLGTMFAGAGMMCRLPAPAHPAMAGCHHPARVPSHPQPADYQCCVRRHASAVVSDVFSVRLAVQALKAADTIHVVMVASDSEAFPIVIAHSGGPPGVQVLRI